MAINLNTDPYYDDFDKTKGFHQILFKPGVAVQARELTQLQSILQNQIKAFGDNIFTEGALVLGGDQSLDKQYASVKLTAEANNIVLSLVDEVIYGTASGMKALVINATQSTESGDPPTLFVKYLNSGKSKEKSGFAQSEVIYNEDKSARVFAAATSVNAVGTAYNILSGVLYVNGNFVYFDDQTAILNKYGPIGSIRVGFEVTESIKTFTDDNSLLDPANGSYNYAAPGADRRAVELTLTTKPFTADAVAEPNFVEIARIQSGEVISNVKNTQYNELGDTLARRTYDESGDYVVRPYNIKLLEHLRTSLSKNDGYFLSTEGGDTNKFINKISPGKAYVKGYEIDNLKNAAIPADKARDTASVENGSVYTPFGNYVRVTNLNGVSEDLDVLPRIDLYDQLTGTPGSSAGSSVGTARIRHVEYFSGTPGTATAQYNVYLFDIRMNTGFSFTNNVKQIYYNNPTYASDFTADIVPDTSSLAGTVSVTSAASTLTGSGTRFLSQLSVGDYITFGTAIHRIETITDDFSATISPSAAATLSGQTFSIVKAKIFDTDKNSYIFPLPVEIVKTIDPTGANTVYSTRRIYERTLTAGVIQVNAGVNETFSSYSLDNMQMYDSAGDVIDITGLVAITGVNNVLTVDLSGLGYTTETVILVATVQKTSSAADKKNKTLVSNATLDVLAEATAGAQTISLAKADIYRLVTIKMTTAGAFGDASYNTASEIDITNRYTLDNGQKATYYGLGSLRLKKGSQAPTAPIRITFDYFAHSGGDYFSVDSYGGINYSDIPTLTLGGNEYVLRDCLDFRPRINDAGTGFSGTGSSIGEFPDFENDIITSYEYYLPRIDKIVLNREGRIKVIKGESRYNPKEPKTPDDSMALYVLKQKAYVFDITKDIEIIQIDNRRYTMRQIGRLENRIKNLEYYTSLNQLEVDTQNYQIKDVDGFDRFKNGFVVDAFRGHGIGDVYNPDYGVSIDYNKNELRPIASTHAVKLNEVATTVAARTSAGYAKTGDMYTLPYTDERFITNNKASKEVNLNPYNIVSFRGKMTGTQGDIWFDEKRVPDVYRNTEGNYDSVIFEAQAKGTFGTIWGSWETLHYGFEGGEDTVKTRSGREYEVTEDISTTTNKDVVVSKTVIAKMRDVSINFDAEGLMPDTRMYVFFNNIDVTADCKFTTNYVDIIDNTNPQSSINAFGNVGQMLATNEYGEISGTFHYSAEKYDLNTGTYMLRITDDPNNNAAMEFTSAEMSFTSSGELRNIANEIVSTRNAIVTSKDISDSTTRTNFFEAGKLKAKICVGYDLYGTYYDGAGDVYQSLIEARNVGTCGFGSPCPAVSTVLDTFCDNVTGNLMSVLAAGPDINGECTTTNVVLETGSTTCVPENPCKEAGTIARTFCNANKDLFGQYFTGTYNYVTGDCDTYQELIEANNVEECGFVTGGYPAAGTPTGDIECGQPGFIKSVVYHDGIGGTYKVVEEVGSEYCGFVDYETLVASGDSTLTNEEFVLAQTYDPLDAPAAGTHNRYECRGYDYYEILADGNWGESATLIEANSEFYCSYETPKDTVYVGTFYDLEPDDDDDGDLDPPRAQIVDTVGYINGVFNHAFGRNMTESEREEASAYFDANGITADTLANATTSGSNIHDGYVDGGQIPDAFNADAEKVGLAVKTMIEVGVARGYGADSDASVTNFISKVPGSTTEGIATSLAIQAVTYATQLDNPGIEDSWAKDAVEGLINNTVKRDSLL